MCLFNIVGGGGGGVTCSYVFYLFYLKDKIELVAVLQIVVYCC